MDILSPADLRGPWGSGSRRLWSLRDMLELKTASFYGVTSGLHALREIIKRKEEKGIEENDDGGITITFVKDSFIVEQLLEQVRELEENLRVLGMRMALISSDKLKVEISSERGFIWERVGGICEEVHNRLLDELSLTKVFVLNAMEQDYFEPPEPLFGAEVASKYLTASFEIDEAAKCCALGRSTASAFHSIRCLEAGIRAISRCLGIPDPTRGSDRSWFKVLKAIRDEIDRRWPGSSNTMSGDGRFFEEAHALLSAMQNPYRNSTMHLDQKYTNDEAEHIFLVVKGFMKKLASRCDENGEPKT